MKAYKFRTSRELQYSLDILLCNRLYCASISNLNDILEGALPIHYIEATIAERKYAAAVQSELQELRVCALTETFENSLLWSHYAGGYDGFAFEFDIDDEDVWQVEYSDMHSSLAHYMRDFSAAECARALLARKRTTYRDERELRIICPFEFYRASRPISRTILGPRVPDVVAFALQALGQQYGVATEWLQVHGDGSMSTRPAERAEFDLRNRRSLGELLMPRHFQPR